MHHPPALMHTRRSLCAAVYFVVFVFWGLGNLRGASALTIEEIKSYCASLPNSTLVIGMVTKGNAELTLQRWRYEGERASEAER